MFIRQDKKQEEQWILLALYEYKFSFVRSNKTKTKKKKILFEDQKLWQVMHQNLAKFTKLQEQKLKTLPNKCLLFKMLKKHCSNLLADLEAYLLIIEIDQKILELTF